MAEAREGTPVWADAMFADVEAAKTFYSGVLGWTFGDTSPEYGGYTQAYSGGKAVAAVVPPMPGQEGMSQWCLYLSSPDASAAAERIRRHGGTVLMEPMRVGDFGTMCLAQDPGGVTFGVWQAGSHEGFEATGEPGAYAWAEVFTREPAAADAFFPGVFGYGVRTMVDEEMDFAVYGFGEDRPALGRMTMGAGDFPPEVPAYVQVYFAVPDCDRAAAMAQEMGGRVLFRPMTSPFGRFAAVLDPQGAAFAVIDLTTAEGEMPAFA
ncbi:VOC family protein [Streptomyces genisteinicus]|uniref:VOC family protein n=1 Tax=Streptomyces genisteinicus TaxID=2768068 RepID=A0A7H0HMK9_9ACTN|nr:VOC family protein [Streptomyces genisteinicus]QNP61775.1 VOC family protein [Streptomyces genisteinicus]